MTAPHHEYYGKIPRCMKSTKVFEESLNTKRNELETSLSSPLKHFRGLEDLGSARPDWNISTAIQNDVVKATRNDVT